MSCWMSNEQKLCEMKILQLQSMSNAMRCIDQRFAFKNSVISFLALIFNLSNLRTTILLWKKRFPVAKHVKLYTIFSFFLTRIYALVIKVSWSESGGSGSIPAGCWFSAEILCSPRPFCVALSLQCTDTCAFYIAELSIIFSFLDFVSCNLALTGCSLWTWFPGYMNIRLPLFWSTWSRAQGPDSATCAGLAHRRDYSDCRASEQSHKSA